MFKNIWVSNKDIAKYLGVSNALVSLWSVRGNKVPEKYREQIISYLGIKIMDMGKLRLELQRANKVKDLGKKDL